MRKLLNGLFESCNLKEKSADILRTIDKIDKIGKEEVKCELMELGVKEDNIDYLIDFMQFNGTNEEKIENLKSLNISNETYQLGIRELEQVISYLNETIPSDAFKIDLTIARGLDYYTGTVYETSLVDYPKIGSVCSGGRYDNLAEYYTDKKLPGVGISIGLTRLFSQLLDAGIIKTDNVSVSDVLIIPMNDDLKYALKVAKELRENNIKTSICYLEKGMKQKFKYANRINVPFVLVLGDDEEKNNLVTLKNMQEGSQDTISLDECINRIKN